MSRRSVRDIPPPLELECLSVLWRLGESSVRTVQEALAASRPLAYTTVMTMLERLARKQLVSRRKVDWHGPEWMAIPLDKILFIEKVGAQSQLAALIATDHAQENPKP